MRKEEKKSRNHANVASARNSAAGSTGHAGHRRGTHDFLCLADISRIVADERSIILLLCHAFPLAALMGCMEEE